MLSFDEIVRRVGIFEMGYVNDPKDPGGETKYGISKRAHPNVDIKNLTQDEATAIFQKEYYEPILKLGLAEEVDYQLFDFAVNSGLPKAIIVFQKIIGVSPDGIIGPTTIANARKYSPFNLIMLLLAARLELMTEQINWSNDGKGWTHRIIQNLRYASFDL